MQNFLKDDDDSVTVVHYRFLYISAIDFVIYGWVLLLGLYINDILFWTFL